MILDCYLGFIFFVFNILLKYNMCIEKDSGFLYSKYIYVIKF